MTTRKSLVYAEIDVSICSLTYGVAPCTASVPTTGTQKCFNSPGSCQDTAHYAASTVTLRFSMDTGFNPDDIEAIPILRDFSITPARISLGEDLGQRESVTLTFREERHSDAGPGFDPYLSTRSYNPSEQGTFWGKFRARQPYLKGQALRLYIGFLGEELSDMECRNYIVETTSGPTDGAFTITAKDPLKALDGDKAQAPALSPGSLSASLTSGGTSATLVPAGIGNSDYPASGYIAVGGKEIMAFTRSGDSLTLSARGSYGTTAQAHSGGDRVQLCLLYTSQDPANIINSLMTTNGGVDSSLIPLTEWQAETAAHNRQLYTTVIAEPVPVRTLVNELIVQAGLAIWSDVVSQTIRLQVLRQIPSDAANYDESVILPGSLSITEQLDKRISAVWTYFAQRNPLEGLEDRSNYRSVEITEDATAEANYGSAAIKTIFSRWIPFGGSSVASRLNDIQLGRYVAPPRLVTFKVFRTDSETIEPGGGYTLAAQGLQDVDGSDLRLPIQVTRLRSDRAEFTAEAESITWTSYDSADLSNRSIAIDSNNTNINLKDIHDSIYPAAVAGDAVTFTVSTAVTIGSTSQSSPAIDTGTWPTVSKTGNRTSGSPIITGIATTATLVAGMFVTGTGIPDDAKILTVDSGTQITLDKNASSGAATSTTLTIYTVRITLVINGKVKAAGGKGGSGANGQGSGTNAGDGQTGGTALKIGTYINLTLASGSQLYGGGGGGGGGPCQGYDNHRGGGGGGGRGYTGGAGGYGPGAGESGTAGSSSAAGSYGRSYTNTTGAIFEGPELEAGIHGGDGGTWGTAGDNGTPSGMPNSRGLGGAAGKAIDGVSLAKVTDAGADIRGTQSG